MIPAITEVNFPSYATLHQATVSLQEMGERTISTQVRIKGTVVPDFTGWELQFKGERFVLPTRTPQAQKDNTTKNALVDLQFHSWVIEQLKHYFFVSLSEYETGKYIPDQYNASVILPLEGFVQLFNKVLQYYFGTSIRMDLYGAGTGIYSTTPVSVEINKTYIWDVLIKFYELFGVRWYIAYEQGTGVYVIKVGYTADAITDHDFEYGYKGGLLKFERHVQDEDVRNILLGRGGEKNLPYRYFKLQDPNNTAWEADPDAIPELANIYFDRLRDINFRWYVRGWMQNSHRDTSWDSTHTFPQYTENDCPESHLFAFRKGKTDTKFDPVEYVKDDDSIEKYGERWGAVDDNDELYPTIQGMVGDGIGRVDQCVDVSDIITDDIQAAAAAAVTTTPIGGTKTITKLVPGEESVTDELLSEPFTIPVGQTGNIQHSWMTPIRTKGGQWYPGTITLDTSVENLVAVDETTGTEHPISGLSAGTYRVKITLTISNASEYDQQATYGLDTLDLVLSSVDENAWKPTFDIWVKNIWGTTQGQSETDEQYATRVWEKILGDRVGNEAKIVFSDGFMSISQDYEFVIAAYPVKDRSKTITVTEDGETHTYTSEWRITLYKSDAEFDATGLYIPNSKTGGKPVAGDHFFFIGIDMPFLYVTSAEERLNGADLTPVVNKTKALDELSDVQPTWVITLDKVRVNTLEDGEYGQTLAERLSAGATVRIKDPRFTPGEVLTLYVKSITYTWNEPTSGNPYLVPDIEVVLSDKVASVEGTVTRVANELNVVKATYAKSSDVEAAVRSVGSALFLKKTGEADSSNSPTAFASKVSSKNFRQGDIGGAGWGFYAEDNAGEESENYVLEVDKLVVRKEMRVNELVANQIAYIGGKQIISAAAINCTQVIETNDSYVCYFDQKQGTVANLFAVGDVAMGQVFDEENTEVRYYRCRVTGVGVDYITLSKSVKDGQGAPAVGDTIVQYGSYTNANRRYVIVRDVIGGGYERMIRGLDSVTASGTEYHFSGYLPGTGPRWFVGDSAGEYAEWVNGRLNIKGTLVIRNSDGSYQSMTDYMAAVQAQIDGQVMSWASGQAPSQQTVPYPQVDPETGQLTGTPNFPASSWTSNTEREKHFGDIYADDSTGQLYRYTKRLQNGTTEYYWTRVSDEEVAALATQVAGLQYLKQALPGSTLVQGGLVLTSLIQLGQEESGTFRVYSGINGLLDQTLDDPGESIAAWFGGPMVDHEKSPSAAQYALSLFRHDGSGYLAGGNIHWSETGQGGIPGITWDGNSVVIGGSVKLESTSGDSVTELINLVRQVTNMFIDETYTEGGQTKHRIKVNPAVYEGLYTNGFLSAGGLNPDSGGGGGGGVDLLRVWQSLTNNPSLATVTSSTPIALAHIPDIPWSKILNKPAAKDLSDGDELSYVDPEAGEEITIDDPGTTGTVLWGAESANQVALSVNGVSKTLVKMAALDGIRSQLGIIQGYFAGSSAYNALALNGHEADYFATAASVEALVTGVSSVVGQTGDVTVAQIMTAITAAGGKLTDTVYTLPEATSGALGGIKIGYSTSGKNYAVQLSSGKAYVNVPWTDTTYGNATTSAAGLMSATDKTKLDGIEAQATRVTEETVAGWGFTKNSGTGTVTQVKVGNTAYNPVSGVVSLPAYPTVPTTVSAFTNDAGYVTASVSNLTNYFLKTETYDRATIDSMIGTASGFHYEIYASLSDVTNPSGNVLYLIGPTGSGADKYDEYVYAGLTWVKIGETSIDLAQYVNSVVAGGSGNYITGFSKSGNILTLNYGTLNAVKGTATGSGAVAFASGVTTVQFPTARGIAENDWLCYVDPETGEEITIEDAGETGTVLWGAESANQVALSVNGVSKTLVKIQALDGIRSSITTILGYFSGGAAYNALALEGHNASYFATASALASAVASIAGKQDTITDLDTIRSQAGHGETAYGWGNHANAGYLTSVPVATASVLGGIMVGQNLNITAGGVLSAVDTTYSPATTSAAGLMSAADKVKLNGIAAGATAVTESTVSGWGFTKNAGTVTGVKRQSDVSPFSPTNGVVTIPDYPTVPTAVSAFTNDSGYITASANNLVNYYKKTETYTQTEVNNLIASVSGFTYEIYPSLEDVTSPSGHVLYLIGPTGSGSDKYEEYVYAGLTWVKIGDTSIDLSQYVNSVIASGSGNYISGFSKSGNVLTMTYGTLPTVLPNPQALTFGTKTYTGSSAQTITAADLGALTSVAFDDLTAHPTTLSGYGITDAKFSSAGVSGKIRITLGSTYHDVLTEHQSLSDYATQTWVGQNYQPLDADLTAIAALSGTSGLLKKTAANEWTLDTNQYLTDYTIYALTVKNSAGTTVLSYNPKTAVGELTLTKAMVGLGNVDNTAAADYFTSLTNDSNQISITVGGTNKKLTVAYASDAGTLGGTAKSGLFTDLSNITSGDDANKISATIGGTTLKLLVNYASNAGSASRLSGNTAYSVWGVEYWANGVPKSVTGRPNLYIGTTQVQVSSAAQALAGITTIAASGLATIQGGISLGGQYNNVDSKLVWDNDAKAWHLIGNLYADGFISAGGLNDGGSGGGVDLSRVWQSLSNSAATFNPDNNSKIATAHLPSLSGTGVSAEYSSTGSGATLATVLSISLTASGVTAGTYTKVTVDQYGRATAGTTLAASDIPTLAISKISGLQTALDNKQPLDADLTAIAGLSGTSGFLKKTAANTWTLDTNTYVPTSRTVNGKALSANISLAAEDLSDAARLLFVDPEEGEEVTIEDPGTTGTVLWGAESANQVALSVNGVSKTLVKMAALDGIRSSVTTLLGYFSGNSAYNALALEGHNASYFATASGLAALTTTVASKQDTIADLSTIRTQAGHGETAYGWGDHASAGYLTSVPAATGDAFGGIKIGYTASGKNYAVQLSDGKAYVNVPWIDTAATTSAAGLMSAADKSKLDGIASGATNVVESTVSGWGFTKNAGTVTGVKREGDANPYSPVNGVVTLPAYPTVPTAVSAFTNDAGYITKSVSDLTNYYTTSQTYNRTEIQNLIGSVSGFTYEIYPTLADVTSPSGHVLYLIGPTGSGQDKYEEYVYAGLAWVKIGDTSIDLSSYVNSVVASGSGNYVSGFSKSGNILTLTMGTLPTALPNPAALTFGSKTYNGSEAKTITASDLGALTSHQTIYALTIKNSGGTTVLTYTPNSAAGSITLSKDYVGLSNVENTKLSTWAGSQNITTLGTISTGVWNGTNIAANKLVIDLNWTLIGNSASYDTEDYIHPSA